MKLGVLFSGGKDSMLALMKAKKFHKISCLITMKSINPESYMFHTPNIYLVEMQAKSLGLPLISVKTKGEKEKELNDLKRAIMKAVEDFNIDGIVSGAIRSVYQATRIQKICDELGLWCFNPLWLMDQEDVLKQVIKNNIKAVISSIAGYPLTKDFLGKEINKDLVNKLISLKKFINPAGEGGELETSVLDCPIFKSEIKILDSEILYENFSGVFFIKKIKEVMK